MLAKKGGVGKSTLALLLHEAFRQAGKSVAIRDWDAQGTSTKALRLIGGQQAMLEGTYEVLLYDTPPNLEHVATGYAVQNTDIALVVTSPSPADIWEADEALRFVQANNPHAVARLIFGPCMNVQSPPNLVADDYPALLEAGLNDWGGISPLSKDYVNPEAPWPHLEKLGERCARSGFRLIERLAIYPEYIDDNWLDPAIAPRVRAMQTAIEPVGGQP